MLHLVLYLFLSNSHHSLKKELEIANKELVIFKNTSCSDPEFIKVYGDFATELYVLSDVVKYSSTKDVVKNEPKIKAFISASKQVVDDQNSCIDGLETYNPANNKS